MFHMVLMCFFITFGYWVLGRRGGGLVHHLVLQVCNLGSTKIQVSETYFLIL